MGGPGKATSIYGCKSLWHTRSLVQPYFEEAQPTYSFPHIFLHLDLLAARLQSLSNENREEIFRSAFFFSGSLFFLGTLWRLIIG